MALLPERWCNVSASQFASVASTLNPEQEYVDWRAFLLVLSEPWPKPTLAQLLQALAVFKELDQLSVGYLTREQYDYVGTNYSLATMHSMHFMHYMHSLHYWTMRS